MASSAGSLGGPRRRSRRVAALFVDETRRGSARVPTQATSRKRTHAALWRCDVFASGPEVTFTRERTPASSCSILIIQATNATNPYDQGRDPSRYTDTSPGHWPGYAPRGQWSGLSFIHGTTGGRAAGGDLRDPGLLRGSPDPSRPLLLALRTRLGALFPLKGTCTTIRGRRFRRQRWQRPARRMAHWVWRSPRGTVRQDVVTGLAT